VNQAEGINLMVCRFDDVLIKYIIKLTNHQIIKSTFLRRTLVQHNFIEQKTFSVKISPYNLKMPS